MPDIAETWLSLISEQAAGQNLQVDLTFIQRYGHLCPVCGQESRRREPYPGVVLETYHDAARRLVIPFWACQPCSRLLRDADETGPDLLTLRIRHRLDEFLV